MNDAVLSLQAAADVTRTGDLWLFRGKSTTDHAIRAITNAPVNHVGMAVVLDDLPPLMWHAELGRGLLDVWTGDHHRGALAGECLGVGLADAAARAGDDGHLLVELSHAVSFPWPNVDYPHASRQIPCR